VGLVLGSLGLVDDGGAWCSFWQSTLEGVILLFRDLVGLILGVASWEGMVDIVLVVLDMGTASCSTGTWYGNSS